MHASGLEIGISADTHLNDLQADIEAGSRQLEQIHHAAAKIRDALLGEHVSQAESMGSLVKQIIGLRASLQLQRHLMRELRHDIRKFREASRQG